MPVLPDPQLLAMWTSCAQARDGARLCIRPLRPDDREREAAFIDSLSERTRYFRLLTPLKFLTPHLLDQFMDIDYVARMALVATVEHDGVEEFVGVARYGLTDQPDCAELGITVTDAWQRKGIARILIERLLAFARWRGLRTIIGLVLPENVSMLALAKDLGFAVRYDRAEHLMRISRDLADARAPSIVPAPLRLLEESPPA